MKYPNPYPVPHLAPPQQSAAILSFRRSLLHIAAALLTCRGGPSSMPSQALCRRTTELTQVWRRRGDMMILDHPAIPLFGRLMMTYIFATSGIGKIFGWSGNVAYMNTRHLPLIPVLLAVAMVIEVAGLGGFVTG